jgi:hypothetical protein
MKPFDYVVILFSMVISLAVTHLLSGIGRLIRAPKVRVSMVLSGWVAYLLLSCVDFWFSVWRDRGLTWDMGTTLLAFIGGAVLYLACWLALPEVGQGESVDLREYHDRSRRLYLGAIVVYATLSIVGVLLTPGQGSGVWTAVAIGGAAATAWIWRSRWVQTGAVIVALATLIYWDVAYVWNLK